MAEDNTSTPSKPKKPFFSGPMSGGATISLYPATALPSAANPATYSGPTRHFDSCDDILAYAKVFLSERLTSLKKDVAHCLTDPYAPFPALSYSIATIELLGGLEKGNVTGKDLRTKKKGVATRYTIDYMMNYMKYTKTDAILLMEVFRHKLAHLATPKAVLRHGNMLISWEYSHSIQGKHLSLAPAKQNQYVNVKAGWSIPVDSIFSISISQLVNDIDSSVNGPNGYLVKLTADRDLQKRFGEAIEQIFDVI